MLTQDATRLVLIQPATAVGNVKGIAKYGPRASAHPAKLIFLSESGNEIHGVREGAGRVRVDTLIPAATQIRHSIGGYGWAMQ